MTRNADSPSISSLSASPSLSDSSSEDNQSIYSEYPDGPPGSPGPGDHTTLGDNNAVEVDTVTCQWERCNLVFTHLQTLIDHIHNGMYSFVSRFSNRVGGRN